VIGKTASCAAMALTFGSYAAPDLARPLAVGAVAALTGVNLLGVRKTALLTRAIVALVLASLAAVVVAALGGGSADVAHLSPVLGDGGVYGLLQAAGLLFFAFAGYARIATLGEEVSNPERTIPRAIPIALFVTLAVYAAVAVAALAAAGPQALARSEAPLKTAIESGSLSGLAPVVRAGATIGSLGVLLSLIVGVSRTVFAMAANRDLPGMLDAVHPRYRVPHRAEVATGVVVILVLLVADVRGAIGFSSFAVLVYYAIANASALTLEPEQRRWPRWVSMLGLAGCLIVAASLPWTSVVGGIVVLLAGVLWHQGYGKRSAGDAET
jgi:APA family basic amino acid/polyamine antiporter